MSHAISAMNKKTPHPLFTVGYGGRSLPGLIAVLTEAGVNILADVRTSPRSPIPGFSGIELKKSLPTAGIEYVHLQELGNANYKRPELGFTLNSQAKGTARLKDLLNRSPTVILCAEKDYLRCHRLMIAELMQDQDTMLKVHHLV